MWCWCSNVVIPAATCVVSGSSLPQRRRYHRQDVQVRELGQTTLMANLESNSTTPISSKQQQISGSDVFWAFQRASARKKMMIKKERERGRDSSSSETSSSSSSSVDYNNVRPLFINDLWAPKLDELEKRLRHLSDTI